MVAKIIYHYTYLLFVLLSIYGCFSPTSTAEKSGAGEETTNGISGILTKDNKIQVGIKVSLYSSNYDPLNSQSPWQFYKDTVTDLNGKYTFKNLKVGEYNLLSRSPDTSSIALLQSIHLPTDSSKIFLSNTPLEQPGKLELTLNELDVSSESKIYIPGTNLTYSISDSDIAKNKIEINLPKGQYSKIMVQQKSNTTGLNILGSPQRVESGKVSETSIFYTWKYQAEISINTSSTGSDISTDLIDFPLLLRLNSSNFNFNQSESSGNDLRFSNSKGKELVYEIENWDPSHQTANVWVKIDTLKGNHPNQTIQVYWGNPQAQKKSNGKEVFRENQGFSGVWHLSDNLSNFNVHESSKELGAIVRQSRSESNSMNISTLGIVGRGFKFSNRYWVDLGQERNYLNQVPAASISGWVKPSFNPSAPQNFGIVNIGVGQENSSISSRAAIEISDSNTFLIRGRALDLIQSSQLLSSNKKLENETWVHVTAIIHYQKDSIYLYLNGNLVQQEKMDFKAKLTENTNSRNSALGAQDNGTGTFFEGLLDEIRLFRGVHSKDWIKMSYENQKPESKVVTFNPPQ